MSLLLPLKSLPAPGADSALLLLRIRRNETALASLRTIHNGPHPDERIIQENISRLRERLMHPEVTCEAPQSKAAGQVY
ncbi:hypothetical protein ACN2XU_16020 [Primorskyibacter sp. 2E107]|uniref:hypothetical protein n=1 Tax=Primorskyibacter sp. 2E107 TaxID=3403458 RepID=UPI003AF8BFC0